MKQLRRIADGVLSRWEDDKADALVARGGFEVVTDAPAEVVSVVEQPADEAEAPTEAPKAPKKSKKGA